MNISASNPTATIENPVRLGAMRGVDGWGEDTRTFLEVEYGIVGSEDGF
jgi:hypothetical protein